jgi:hypothetical protein
MKEIDARDTEECDWEGKVKSGLFSIPETSGYQQAAPKELRQ